MKKSLLALAALTAFAGAASAQSSVTLFGILDLNVRHIKNDDTRTIMSQDGIASSRLGFRGVEDLGGGLKAGFWLEAGVSADNGTTGANVSSVANTRNADGTPKDNSVTGFFNRRATVSLMGNFGELRLGRDFTPDFWNHTVYDPFGTNGVGSSVNAFGTFNGATTLLRANNSVGYFLPAMGGLFGQVMVAAGEGQAGQGNKNYSGRLGYAAGPLSVAAAYGKTDGDYGDWQRFNVGGSYNFGVATVMAQYAQGKGKGGLDDGAKQTLWLLGAVVPMGAHTFKISYVDSNSSGGILFGTNGNNNGGLNTQASIDGRDASQIALGYQYDMSKRTALYGNVARVSNDAGARYTAGGGGTNLAAGKDSTGLEVGIRHSF